MTDTACLSLVAALKLHVYNGDGAALLNDWKDLSDKDKNDLRAWFQAEGIEVAPLAA